MTSHDDDLPEVDQVEAGRIARTLAATSEKAAAIVAEHRDDNFGEVLPTVLMADIARWFRDSELERDGRGSDDARRAVAAVAELYGHHDDSLETIVATGFLEALPHPDEEGREVVERLPAPLREELRRMENWRPPG